MAHAGRQADEIDAFGAAYQDSGLVFTLEDGSPIHPRALSEGFARLNRASGLPRIRFHDLRHTYATVALREGVNPKIVSERLGHPSVAFTFDVYAHFLPGDDLAAAEGFAAGLLGGV
jgi:integrase